MKFLVLLIICLSFQSCLKDIEPLEINSKFALIDGLENNIDGEWFKFYKAKKDYSTWFDDYYYLTIVFEITNSYLLENSFTISIKISHLSTEPHSYVKVVKTKNSPYFSVKLDGIHKEENERCFNAYFNVEGGVANYGKITYCVVA
ncbi:hypothetical protein DNU06_14440 [Putridiphycobacter roseus]|uniref:Lipoprotein n=1 Tax=Putridiphycobacter roseus TaxID=2219161 RepID=A0A2W1MVN1_9FLAO|nr:hypothetical protein [Putridiphycobacter roseus]PZE16159.1 hypothetical protein DNU06_14440 [Putridiphycobacter roseus]